MVLIQLRLPVTKPDGHSQHESMAALAQTRRGLDPVDARSLDRTLTP